MLDILARIYEGLLSKRLENIDQRVAKVLKRIAEQNETPVRLLRILDIGAGNANYWKSKEFSNFPLPIEVTCLDPSPRDVAFDNANTQVTFRQINAPAPEGLREIPDQAFDLVTAFDVIEHLSKPDGYWLLYEMDRIQKTASLIYTPSKFLWQPPSVDNPFNAHISFWGQKEVKSLGWYDIQPHIGLWKLYGPYAKRRKALNGSRLGQLGLTLEAIFLEVAPKFSFSYSAIKWKKGERIGNFDDRSTFTSQESQNRASS